jgi:hypothetical protein
LNLNSPISENGRIVQSDDRSPTESLAAVEFLKLLKMKNMQEKFWLHMRAQHLIYENIKSIHRIKRDLTKSTVLPTKEIGSSMTPAKDLQINRLRRAMKRSANWPPITVGPDTTTTSWNLTLTSDV